MSTTTKPKVLFSLSEDGIITRSKKDSAAQPQAIAVLQEGKVQWSHPDFSKYRLPVSKMLKANKIEAEFVTPEERKPRSRSATLVTDAGFGGEDSQPPANVQSKAATDLGADGMRNLTVEQRQAVNHLRSKMGYPLGEVESPAPPAPKKTSGAGDKTPKYVNWLLRYFPAQFVEVYGIKGMGSIEVVIPGENDPVTGVKGPARRKMEPGHVIARRATHLTASAELRNDDEEESL
jgi:hypothetical protein